MTRRGDRVLLIRQFRWPVFETGYRKLFIEAVAGKLDGDEPEACARREAMEEAGMTLGVVKCVFLHLHEPRRSEGTPVPVRGGL